jgi:LysR substrate binding domain
MLITVSPEHRLARRTEVRLTELSEEVFVDFSPRWGHAPTRRPDLRAGEVARHTEFELENVELLLQFVARGFGIAAVPQSMVEGRRLSHLAIVPKRKSHVLPHWEIGMFRAKTQSRLSPNPPGGNLSDNDLRSVWGEREAALSDRVGRNEAQKTSAGDTKAWLARRGQQSCHGRRRELRLPHHQRHVVLALGDLQQTCRRSDPSLLRYRAVAWGADYCERIYSAGSRGAV